MFKANWEKIHTQHQLSDDLIKNMLAQAMPDRQIKDVAIVEGGCANINIKVNLVDSQPMILRVYLRDPSAARREQLLANKLSNIIPIPNVYQVCELHDYTFAITEFLSGITLRDYIIKHQISDNDFLRELEGIMSKVGATLSKIAAIKFEDSGIFNENLNVDEPMTQARSVTFARNTLSDKNVRLILSDEQRHQINHLLDQYGQIYPDGSEKNLVHADFDPANILVEQRNGQVEIAGILDWEFAFSGSSLCDVANMLRYAHHMPKCYEQAFLHGLTSSGYCLPENWRVTVHMLNLLSLLDCLRRSDPINRPNQIADIRELIQFILSQF